MEFRDIPAVDDSFEYRMQLLRNQISKVVSQNPKETPLQVEFTLDNFLPENVLAYLQDWAPQKPKLEEILITNFLGIIVPFMMEPDRKNGQLYQYSLRSEGWCLHPSHKDQPHFTKGQTIAKTDFYTLDELVKNWRDIFVLDRHLDENPSLRMAYAPRHKHDGFETLGELITTRHELRIVDKRGNYIPGTSISFARTKSGVRHVFKLAEWLTGIRENHYERKGISDYMAALSRVPDYQTMWLRAMQIIRHFSKENHTKLDNVLFLQRYSPDEVYPLKKFLEADPDIGNFISGRTDLDICIERSDRGRRNDRKFAEIFIPVQQKNILGYQFYTEDDYTKSEGVLEQRHDNYRRKREQEIARGFTPWHWAIIRRIAPFFVDSQVYPIFARIYGRYLSLDYKK
ncbi:hypothetical protein HYX01_00605 [Candidatus Woesearchaeota archaeon]|nr:hypothetical protein [Candidatus Woesearchaeota archaeon]